MNKPLHKSIADSLRDMIFSGDLGVGDRLPTEPVLAGNMGVSRATLREALNQIESEGLIYRVHGLGTFVKTKHPSVSLTMTIPRSITGLLDSLNLIPGTSSMTVSRETVFPDDVDRLDIQPDSMVYRIERTRTANGQPVAYSIDTVPAWAMKKHPERSGSDNFSLVEHLTYACGITIGSSRSTLIPLHNVQSVAEKLEIDPSAHIFFAEGLDCDENMSPVLFSREYFAPWIFRFTLERK